MNIARRAKFTTSVDNKEAAKEFQAFGRMVKKDPLAPVGFYARNMVLPGAGLLLEGYVLFSIGNLKPLFQVAFPTCWGSAKPQVCDPQWQHAVDYLEIVGIMLGQVLVGILGDWLGRRWGLIQDAAIMLLGLVMLIAAWGTSFNGWVICYAWSLFVYGIGVGGEYPMTATSGMENAVGSGKISTRDDRLHRGRKVTSAFLMQGWGQVLNQAILIILFLIFHGSAYDMTSAQWTYRISFAIPAVGTLWLVYYRIYKMRSASKQLDAAKKKAHVTGYDTKSLKYTVTYFGSRLIATALAWFCNDVFFYGNKLFQGDFIKAISGPHASVLEGWLWSLCNAGVSLAGYYMATFFIDNKLYGRKWMMIVGFFLTFVLFVIPAFGYEYYTTTGVHAFQAMYFLSSFFNQFGPNSVTFIVAAEVYPTPIRASAHGFSAMVGKAGALLAAILNNYLTTPQIFKFVPWFGLAGAVVTWVFLPDTTGLDLKEAERRWNYIVNGRESEYHGVAVHPKHLSLWERLRGVGKHYDAQADYVQKLEEYRGDWESWQARKAEEQLEDDAFDDDEFSDEVTAYFARTPGGSIRGVPVGSSTKSEKLGSESSGSGGLNEKQ